MDAAAAAVVFEAMVDALAAEEEAVDEAVEYEALASDDDSG